MNETLKIEGMKTSFDNDNVIVVKTEREVRTHEYERTQLDMHSAVSVIANSLNLPAPHIVKKCACKAVGITGEQFDSVTRKREIVLARQIAMTYYLANDKLFRFSLEDIGNFFGKKDHATVIHAGRSINHLRETNNPQVVAYVSMFITNLQRERVNYPTKMTPLDRNRSTRNKEVTI